MWRDEPRLPPLVVRSIYDMEDIPIREAQALAGQAAVPGSIIVKQSSNRGKKKSFGYTPSFYLEFMCKDLTWTKIKPLCVHTWHRLVAVNFLHCIIGLCHFLLTLHIACMWAATWLLSTICEHQDDNVKSGNRSLVPFFSCSKTRCPRNYINIGWMSNVLPNNMYIKSMPFIHFHLEFQLLMSHTFHHKQCLLSVCVRHYLVRQANPHPFLKRY